MGEKEPGTKRVRDAAFRDHVAVQVASICMADLSRQLANNTMPIVDTDKAIQFIATVSYAMADAMIEARDRK